MYQLLSLISTSLLFSSIHAGPQVQAAPAANVATPTSSAMQSQSSAVELSNLGKTGYVCLYRTTFPLPPAWESFDALSKANQQALGSGSSDILKAIQTFNTSPNPSMNAKQFQALLLAMVMQESGGNGNVVMDKQKSHGILQVQVKGEQPATCDPNGCTYDNYLKMLQQGVYGHSGTGSPAAPGIAYWLGSNSTGPALRAYNSGSVVDRFDYQKVNHDSQGRPTSTESYVSDVGNRLAGVTPDKFPDKQWLSHICGFEPVPPEVGS
ncbi:MAG: hypothetical protein LQ350_001751 [Teloschistes chrysophthalmus]|nr:MAG: hypothetical protein LQ350_001751 [Niorma chrysophthalma]